MVGIMAKLAANISNENPEFLQIFHPVLVLWWKYFLEGEQLYIEKSFVLDQVSVSYLRKIK